MQVTSFYTAHPDKVSDTLAANNVPHVVQESRTRRSHGLWVPVMAAGLFEAARFALERLIEAVGDDFDDQEGAIADMIHELNEIEGQMRREAA